MTAAQDTNAFALEENLGLKSAETLMQHLRESRGQPVALDAANVSHIGALALQVLLSAKKTWEAEQTPFEVINPSEAFQECVTRIGFSINPFIQEEK